jgi:hypothetical protein
MPPGACCGSRVSSCEIGLAGTITAVALIHSSHGLVFAVRIASAAFARVDTSVDLISEKPQQAHWVSL